MSDREAIQVDLLTILLYSLMVLAGWANIYAAGYSPGQELSLFSIDTEAGKQLLYMGGCLLIILTILVADFKLWDSLGYFFYGLFFILLVAVLFFGNSTGGAQSWFAIPGVPFKIQPSEFAKVGTALAVGKFVGNRKGELPETEHYFLDLAKLTG